MSASLSTCNLCKCETSFLHLTSGVETWGVCRVFWTAKFSVCPAQACHNTFILSRAFTVSDLLSVVNATSWLSILIHQSLAATVKAVPSVTAADSWYNSSWINGTTCTNDFQVSSSTCMTNTCFTYCILLIIHSENFCCSTSLHSFPKKTFAVTSFYK